ncbi:MAG: hypothetical protein ACFE9O_09275 [Promethearchaeota archaeon]
MRINRNIVVLIALCTLLLPFVSTWFSGFQVDTPISVAALPAPTVTPRILYYTEFADNGPGGEAENVWAAINATHGTDYLRTNLTSYMDAAAELPNHDIFLIIEQELITAQNITDVATAWQTPLDDFLADGGIVLLMTYYSFGITDYGGTAQILNETGHFSFSAAYTETSNLIIINDPSDPLADGISSYAGPDGTLGFVTSETTVVASGDLSGYGVVFHKQVGVGHLAVMGFDCYTRATETDEILGNAIRLYQPPSAPVLADPGATIAGFQVPLNWTAATDSDGVIVEYEVQASADAGFAIIGQSASVTTLSHTFLFLSNDTYYFRVRAIDNNTLIGPWSNVVSTYVEIPPITLPFGIPGFPIEAIVLGLLLSLGAIFVLRHRKQRQVSS